MEYSAATCRNDSSGCLGPIFMGIIAASIILGMLMAVNYAFSHGPTKHGDAALEVRQCLDSKGPMSVWVNELTGRQAHICDLDNRWGVQIRINYGEDELTAFIKEKMMKYEQVVKYLKNRGYHCISGECL